MQARHQEVCKRLQIKRRAPFDSRKQRTIPLPDDYGGPPPDLRATKAQVSRRTKPTGRPDRDIRRARKEPWEIRSADDVVLANRVPPRPLHFNKREMIECPHCLRQFQDGSADRHIRFCKEIHSRMPLYKENWQARYKLAVRTQYQPPVPRTGRRQASMGTRSTCSSMGTVSPPAHALSSRHHRSQAPMVESGVLSEIVPISTLPGLSLHHNMIGGSYHVRDYDHQHLDGLRPIQQRSRMVTYGAVQPFSGPALAVSKDGVYKQQTRFANKIEPKRVRRFDLEEQDDYCTTVACQHPNSISAQIQTDPYPMTIVHHNSRLMDQSMMSPCYPWYCSPVNKHNMYHGPLLPPALHQPPPWCMSEDAYLQMVPTMSPWYQYPVLPDLTPQALVSVPQSSRGLVPRDSPRRGPYQSDVRFMLRREGTLVDDGNSLVKWDSRSRHGLNVGRYCGNCGAARPSGYGSHYCQGCGTSVGTAAPGF